MSSTSQLGQSECVVCSALPPVHMPGCTPGLRKVTAERDRLRKALKECCRLSGADLSDGFPTWPELPEFAVQCVQTLRIDCDDTADLDEADRLRRALEFIATGQLPGQYFTEAADNPWSAYAHDVLKER